MRRSVGFWFVYAVAWLPFAASYVNYFVAHLGRTFSDAIATSLTGVVPAALLGIGVVAICNRLRWSRRRRVRFVSTHVVLGVLYYEVWMAAVGVFHGLVQKIQQGASTGSAASATSFDAGMITGLMIYATIGAIVYSIQAMERLRTEEARVAQLESLRTRAELETLRAQLNPHFLFNTLHSLMALVRHDPKAAEDALERLATLLRHTLMTTTETKDVRLREELDFIQNYLALERLRLGERLRVEENIQTDTLDCMIPPLTLQPLVENSIKHAISSQRHGGQLTIKSGRHDGYLELEVLDDGPGANLDDIACSDGAGLKIARQRLVTRYDNRASFEVTTRPGAGFCVRMQIPVSETT